VLSDRLRVNDLSERSQRARPKVLTLFLTFAGDFDRVLSALIGAPAENYVHHTKTPARVPTVDIQAAIARARTAQQNLGDQHDAGHLPPP
jgi:hypothetical protein